jgi:hypothetical protein
MVPTIPELIEKVNASVIQLSLSDGFVLRSIGFFDFNIDERGKFSLKVNYSDIKNASLTVSLRSSNLFLFRL